jgi:hypothetical protein
MPDTTDMTDTEKTHAPTAATEQDHGQGHAHTDERLGPVDVMTWAYAGAGSLLGLVVLAALFVARGG